MTFDPRDWRNKLIALLVLLFLVGVVTRGYQRLIDIALHIIGLFIGQFGWLLLAIGVAAAVAITVAIVRSKRQSWRWKR